MHFEWAGQSMMSQMSYFWLEHTAKLRLLFSVAIEERCLAFWLLNSLSSHLAARAILARRVQELRFGARFSAKEFAALCEREGKGGKIRAYRSKISLVVLCPLLELGSERIQSYTYVKISAKV